MKTRFSHALLIVAGLSSVPVLAAETPPESLKNETTKVDLIPTQPVAIPVASPAQALPQELPQLAPAQVAPATPALPAPGSAPETAAITSAPAEDAPLAWDYRSLAEWRRLLASDPVVSVAFAPNNQLIAGGGDGKVFLWNAQGDLVSTISTEPVVAAEVEPAKEAKDDLLGQKPPAPLAAKKPIKLLMFSPDGRILATSSDSTVKLWNAETGALLKILASHEDDVTSITFTPDSRAIATGSLDKNIKIWSVISGQLLGTLSQHVYPVRAVAFSADVKSLLSVGAQGRGRKNGEFKIWDVAGKGDLLQENTLDGVAPDSVKIVAQGRILAAGSDGVMPLVKLWDPQTAKFVRATAPAFAMGTPVTTIAFTPDYALVAGGGLRNKKNSAVWLWEVKTGKMIKEIRTSPQNALAFSPDGRVLAVASQDKAVQLWRVP